MPKRAKKLSDDEQRKISALEARILAIRGGILTRAQQRDIDWLQAEEARQVIAKWIDAVPKGEYCRLSGRQHKLIDDCVRNYGLPLAGETVNLGDALQAIHDLIASNSYKLRSPKDEASLREEKLRQEIFKLEQCNEQLGIRLKFERGQAIDKAALRQALVTVSAKLRECGQTLGRIHPDAKDTLNHFLETLAEEMESGALAF